MSSTLFEIIELANGEFVLQRSGAADEPLVSIKFSAEAREFLSEASAEIARCMIEAGIEEVEEIMDGQFTTEGVEAARNRVLH